LLQRCEDARLQRTRRGKRRLLTTGAADKLLESSLVFGSQFHDGDGLE